MRNVYYGFSSIIIHCGLLLILPLALSGQDQCAPVGWATLNGGTTGGGSVTPVTVSTLSALQTAANSSGAKVIYVSGVMGAGVGTRVRISSDKTIFGLPGAQLNGGFDIKDAHNVILRNMIVVGPGAVDVDGVDCINVDNSTNVWVDHCEVRDGQDGNFDIVNGSNYVAVTWTKFSYSGASVEHQFCNLIGNSDSKTSDRTKLKVTMMFNYWTEGCVERMPRVRFGQVHVVNNLFDSPDASYCVRAGIEADIMVENNAFIGVRRPVDLYENNFTAVTATGNLFSGTTGNTAGSGTSFNPYASYSLPEKMVATAVEAKVKACVGAKLSVPTTCPCATALPVVLLDFSVKKTDTHYQLDWTVSQENSYEYAIAECAANGEFIPVATISKASKQCSIQKEELYNADVLYFRIKFVEADGTISYSPVKSIHTEDEILLYPNPFSEILNADAREATTIMIQNAQGLTIYKGIAGKIPTGNYTSGVYIISVFDQNDVLLLRKVMVK
jgi:pectate lyase